MNTNHLRQRATKESILPVAAVGFSLSVLLAALEALHHRDVWMILQLPGFLVGASIWGVHSGGYTFEIVMVLINGILYSLLLLFSWSILHVRRKLY
jgi:hypothetical protein